MKRMALTLALLSGFVLGAVAISTAADAAGPRSRDLRGAQEVRGADGEIVRDGKPLTPEQAKAAGMAEAPAVIQRSGATCTMTDALATGNGKVTINGASMDVRTYEVACSEGLGYLLQDRGATAVAFDCIAVSANAAATAAAAAPAAGAAPAAAAAPVCRLAANTNPVAMIQPLVTSSGARCTVTGVNFLGRNDTVGLSRYEVGCSEGMGYVIDRPTTGAAKATDCLAAATGSFDCALTPKAARTAFVASIAAKSNRPCTVGDARVMGASTRGTTYYEIACTGAQGYVLETNAGAYVRALDCLEAASIGGGCTLTDVSAVASAREGVYLQALKAKGIPCNGNEFRLLGKDSRQRDVVEFTCSDRPAGLVAFIPQSGSTASDITNFDCFEAEGRNLRCELTSHASLVTRMTASMNGRCTVKNYQVLGPSATTDGLVVEVACTDGAGYVVDLPETRGAVSTALTCAHAATRQSEKCSLPENKAS